MPTRSRVAARPAPPPSLSPLEIRGTAAPRVDPRQPQLEHGDELLQLEQWERDVDPTPSTVETPPSPTPAARPKARRTHKVHADPWSMAEQRQVRIRLPTSDAAVRRRESQRKRASIMASAHDGEGLTADVVARFSVFDDDDVAAINGRLRMSARDDQMEAEREERLRVADAARKELAAAAAERQILRSGRRHYAASVRHSNRCQAVAALCTPASAGPTPQQQRRLLREQLREADLQHRTLKRVEGEITKDRTAALADHNAAIREHLYLLGGSRLGDAPAAVGVEGRLRREERPQLCPASPMAG
eukprot:TRINITY_DN39707_c0_g1_i1.p1 TRINITY_DN39707_c0_g1~~TRINITY_DN39707_c0_g1_i1.p1  ORF type:complete len:304 (+),score=76.54 TRINITY_DN39707_c0_g1_i1:64-975(+)